MSANNELRSIMSVGGERRTLTPADFDLSNGVPGEERVIAELQPTRAIVLSSERLRIAISAREVFDNTGGDQTLALSHNLIDHDLATIEVYVGGEKTEPSNVDYANNEITVDASAGGPISAFYITDDDGQLAFRIAQPETANRATHDVWRPSTALMHMRNQMDRPFSLDFDSYAERVIPRKWRLQITLRADWVAGWDDSDTNNPQGVRARNAVLAIPCHQVSERVEGIEGPVSRSIFNY